MNMDTIIQIGIWADTAEQRRVIDQAARDADFEGFDSVEQYVEAIEASHDEDSTEFGRGPIDPAALEYLESAIQLAWDRDAWV